MFSALKNWKGSGGIDKLAKDISAMADCEFGLELQTPATGAFVRLRPRLATMVSNVNETMRQLTGFTEQIAVSTADIAARNDELAERTQSQAASLEETSATMEELTSTVQQNAETAEQARERANQANRLALDGQTGVGKMMESMESIADGSKQIGGIIEVINAIAFQTNILSLNAAVEAARAGEQGRGFAVVASEVRSLATRCSDAARQISSLVAASSQTIEEGRCLATEVQRNMDAIVEGVGETSALIGEISVATTEQGRGIQQANEALVSIDTVTQENAGMVESLAKRAGILERQSRFLTDAVSVFRLTDSDKQTHPIHEEMKAEAMTAGSDIQRVLEQAIDRGRITEQDLFDRHYDPIPDTDPQKYTSRFDALTDDLLPPIQEPILERYACAAYAVLVDDKSYLPTHNKRNTKPLTGNKEIDLVGNRTKRIFNDRVGLVAGTQEDPHKLQVYRRDTGELMFDISVPIFVRGRRWGGFRIGYSIG